MRNPNGELYNCFIISKILETLGRGKSAITGAPVARFHQGGGFRPGSAIRENSPAFSGLPRVAGGDWRALSSCCSRRLAMEEIAIFKFIATCPAVLKNVRKTGKAILVRRFGEPMAEVVPLNASRRASHWVGSMAGRGQITTANP